MGPGRARPILPTRSGLAGRRLTKAILTGPMNTATDVAQGRTRSLAPRRRVHPRSWLSEFVGTAALLFSAVTCSRWLFAPNSALARLVTGVHWRMVIVGLVVGIVLSLLIVSPLGRRSGGHLNPAITIAFWRLGAFPRRDVPGYVAAQLAGSVAGTALAGLVWGRARHGDRSDSAWYGPKRA